MFHFDRWLSIFADQVGTLREARTGLITLLHDAEIEGVPGMEGALYTCYVERVRPKDAARRYVAMVDTA